MKGSKLGNIPLRYKLNIPNILLLSLLVVAVILFFSSKTMMDRLVVEQKDTLNLSDLVRQTAFSIQNYLSHNTTFEELRPEYQKLQAALKGGPMEKDFQTLWTEVEKFHQLLLANRKIEEDFFGLTKLSIEQSNGYIKMVSEKLADEKEREAVSKLERLVIIGANVNTSSNYELMVRFLQLKESLKVKESILQFINTAIENVERDVKALAGTPFQGMAEAAREANFKIKELTLNFIANTEAQQAIQASLISALNKKMTQIQKENVQANQGFMNRIGSYFVTFFIVIVAASLLGLLFSWLTARGILKPLERAMGLAKAIRAGDLSRRLKMEQKDEMGQLAESLDYMADRLEEQAHLADRIASGDLRTEVTLASDKDTFGLALRKMVDSLNEILGQTVTAVMQVDSGSSQVSDASQSLSQGSTEQAASLEEITSSMTELGSQTKTNAENASAANDISSQAREAAEEGNKQMKGMIQAMEEINVSSKEIAKIIKAIDDIAFQTNLLALNAAVEAARAGKHGKGFAVVAQEVRNLAGRSAKAAQDTAELIENSVKKVQNGADIVNETAQSLEAIVENAAKVSDLLEEIASASNEQAQGITQINQGLGQVEQVTQQNTANAEQTASAAQQLSSQAAYLRELLSRFKLKKAREKKKALAEAPAKKSATPKPLPPPASDEDSWGRLEPKAQKAKKEIKPSDIIALDDDEFGKY